MTIHPIIPIWLMIIICCLLLACKRKGIWPYIRQIIIIVLLFVINLRIMIPSDNVESKVVSKNVHVLFVVDDTISMLAKDYADNTTRLSAVKKDCEYIIDKLNGARFSIISFNNMAQVLMPFTDNVDCATSNIESIYPLDQMYAKGTSLNVAKSTMLKMLENAKKQQDGQVILFFLSDGEMNSEKSLDSFAEVANVIDNGAVMGYGTEQGGKMYVKPFFEDTEVVVQDSKYQDAISRIDEGNLKELAKDMNISYVNMKEQKNIDAVLDAINTQASTSTEDTKKSGGKDIYYIFVIPLALMLVYECIYYKRRA